MKQTTLIGTALLMAGCPLEQPPEDALRFAAMFSDVSGGESIDALKMVADEANAAGLFPQPVEIVSAPFDDQTDRSQQAMDLIDDGDVIGIISEFSSTALNVLRVTNTPAYEDVVQCSASSTNTTINDPETQNIGDLLGADQNDTLYRTVTSDIFQAQVVYQLIEDPAKVALFTIDDPYGSSFRVELQQHAAASASPLVMDDTILTAANQGDLEAAAASALAANEAGTVDTIVIVGFVEHTGPMIQALVEASPPFAGAIILTDGAIQIGDFVTQTGALSTWLGVAGNSLRATSPDTASGVHSTAWLERFTAVTGSDTLAPFKATAADCLYSMLIGLVQGTADGAVGAAAIKAGMPKQKVANRSGDLVDVEPSADGLSAAVAAIAEAKAVRLDGASGVIEFDEDGDRASENYAIFVVTGTGPFSWVKDQVWDPTLGECVSSCD